jgi:type IV pilus assembly protein PilA
MKKIQQAFTLIELMIVVAIIGILAVIAIPAYQTYVIRAQISEGLNMSGPLKIAVAAFHKETGIFPTNNTEAALGVATSFSGNYVDSISISGAEISILYGNNANAKISGSTVTITALSSPGSMSWTCASGGVISDTFLPSSCR